MKLIEHFLFVLSQHHSIHLTFLIGLVPLGSSNCSCSLSLLLAVSFLELQHQILEVLILLFNYLVFFLKFKFLLDYLPFFDAISVFICSARVGGTRSIQ